MASIITGHHRSGTSILALLCNSHPAIMLTNEFGNFFSLGESYPAHVVDVGRRWLRRRNVPFNLSFQYEKKIKGAYALQNLFFAARYLAAVRHQSTVHVNAMAIRGGLQRLYPHATIVGDKHPDYAYILDKLTQDPALKCIFIYRDPRDFVSSVVKAARTVWRGYFPDELRNAEAAAGRWVKSIERMKQYEDKLHVVCYEELVLEPQPVLNALGTFLDVDPTGFDRHVLRTDSIGKHRDGLTTQEISSVVDIAGPTMEQLGMPL